MGKSNKKMAKKRSAKMEEELATSYRPMEWFFIGFVVWLLLVMKSAHAFRMNNDSIQFFFYLAVVIATVDIYFMRLFFQKSYNFSKIYEKRKLFAYFSPSFMGAVMASCIFVLSISHIILPYFVHAIFSSKQQMLFEVSEKRKYILCPNGDSEWQESSVMEDGCRLVRDVCMQNEQFEKFKFCTSMLSKKDWRSVRKGDTIAIKGKISFLGIKPMSYVLFARKSIQADKYE